MAGTLGNANYHVIGTTDGSWTVTPADITVTALGGTSVYGASPSNPGLSASGLQNGEDVGVLSGLTNSFGITGTSGVGSSPYTLTVAGTLGNANYHVIGTTDGSWTVTPADITVTALGGTSVYGASPSNPGLSASGLQNGEDVGVLSGLTNSFGITGTSGVGSSPYTLTVAGTLGNANYHVIARNSGSWTVTPANLTAPTSADPSQFASTVANGVFNSPPWFMDPMMMVFGAENAFGVGAGMSTFGGGIFSTEFQGAGNSGMSLFYSDNRFGP